MPILCLMFVSTVCLISVETTNRIYKMYLSINKHRTPHDLWEGTRGDRLTRLLRDVPTVVYKTSNFD